MTLLERVQGVRRCRDCGVELGDGHPDIPFCDRCLRAINAAYRPTPAPRQPEWLRRAKDRDHGLAKDLSEAIA